MTSLCINPPACVITRRLSSLMVSSKKNSVCLSVNASTDKRRWVVSGFCSEKRRDTVRICLTHLSQSVCFFALYCHIGKNNTALQDVADVACLHGECVVYRCLQGYYDPAPDGHDTVSQSSQFNDAEGESQKFLPSLCDQQTTSNYLDFILADLHQTIVLDNRLCFSQLACPSLSPLRIPSNLCHLIGHHTDLPNSN